MIRPKHIIISRTDSIGDVVLTLPIAGYLKQVFPSIRISFLCRSYTEPIVSMSKAIDNIINWDILCKEKRDKQLIEFKRLQADWIVHAFPDYKLASLSKKAGIKNRVGTSHRLFHWFNCNKLVHFSRRRSNLHEAQLNFKLLKPLGIETIPDINDIPNFYSLADLPRPSEKLISLIDPNRFNVILHPRSKGSAREWGLSNYDHLIKLLSPKKYKIFITGTQDDGNAMKEFLYKNENHVTNLTGNLNLTELIIFISLADALIASSTGPLHIAAALGKKAIGIYAPIRPMHPGRWAPLGKSAKVIAVAKECNLCRHTNNCSCIKSIKAEHVLATLEG